MEDLLGIDLGTTSSRIAVIKDGFPVIIENSEGDGTTPSHVAFTTTGEHLIGKAARRYALKYPSNVFFAIKRLIGRRYDDPFIKVLKKYMPYEIVEAKNGDAWVKSDGKSYSPEEITASTLVKLKESAEYFLGHVIKDVIITVPAYFNESQRKATKDAARIAGLSVLRLRAEPTVAALAYGMGKFEDERIVVYDLGGGTFDISVLELGDGIYEVKATGGDMLLGGEDFDFKIVEFIAREFRETHGIDLLKDPIALIRLKEASEKAKIILSSEPSAEIDLPFIASDYTGVKHLKTELTREWFENLIEKIINRSIKVCEEVIRDADFQINDINQVILVGGSTRIPKVKKALFDLFGQKPLEKARREDLVVLGAAIEAGVLAGVVKDVLLLDVIPISVGIETMGGVMTRLIERNDNVPTKRSEIFSTGSDNQPSVEIHVLQGESSMAKDNRTIGRFHLDSIPPAPRGVPQIEVTFDIDANGILSVSAKDKDTGKNHKIRIQGKSGLAEEEVEKLSKAVKSHSVRADDIDTGNYRRITLTPSKNPSNQTKTKNTNHHHQILISYAHEDNHWAQKIYKSLSMLTHNSKNKIWIDRIINTGDYWEEEIYSQIEKSDIAILVLSHDFLNSPFILENELPRIFAEKERRYLKIIPVMARSCPFELHTELAKFQFFNNPQKPFASLDEWQVDEELTRLALELAKLT